MGIILEQVSLPSIVSNCLFRRSLLMQHVALIKVNKAVAWTRHLFEFPRKFPQSYSDAIYEDKMDMKKNVKQSPKDIENVRYEVVVSTESKESDGFLCRRLLAPFRDIINTLQNARHYKSFSIKRRKCNPDHAGSGWIKNWQKYLLLSNMTEQSSVEIKTRNLSYYWL